MKFSQNLTLFLLISVFIAGVTALLWSTHLKDNSNPGPEDLSLLMEQSVNNGAELFETIYTDFRNRSSTLKDNLLPYIQNSASASSYFQLIRDFDFWNVSVYKNSELIAWNGFSFPSPPEAPEIQGDSLYTSILKQNNVILLYGYQTVENSESGQLFEIVTTRQLDQKNSLPIATGQEMDLSNHSQLSNLYPVNFSFFTPLVSYPAIYQKLTIADQDSVGIVYAESADRDIYLSSANKNQSRVQSSLIIGIVITGIFILLVWFSGNRTKQALLFIITGLTGLWVYLQFTDFVSLLVNGLMPNLKEENLTSAYGFISYSVHTFYIASVTAAITLFVQNQKSVTSNNNHYISFLLSALFGILNLVLILFFIDSTSSLITSGRYGLAELTIYPTYSALLFYTISGLFLSSILILLISTGWMLFIYETDKSTIIALLSFITFVLGLFISGFILEEQIFLTWKFFLAIGLFATVLLCTFYIFRLPVRYLQTSGIRKLLFFTLIISVTGYVIINAMAVKEQDQNLLKVAGKFANEDTNVTRGITQQVLASIEMRFLFLSGEDIETRPGIVQSQFQRVVQASIQPEWRQYSFDIQLLEPDGSLISDYSTTLDSPAWTAYFDVDLMDISYRGEQIRRETNRPVIRGKPAGLGEQFSTLHRGWIPIYDDLRPDEIIAWVFAAVYQERPDYNKPIRAVLAASTGDEWKKSYYIAEFSNGIISRNIQKGFYEGQPEYNRLPEREQEIALSDSIAYISNFTGRGQFREVLLKHRDDKIIKASTPVPGFNVHLFSFFRYNISLILLGIFLFPLLSFLGLRQFALFKQSVRFQNRLLDGLAIAVLIFLVSLIITTQFTMTNQVEDRLERDLITKLNEISETLNPEIFDGNDESFTFASETSTAVFDVDAIFYRHGTVQESTTPQIFQQHIIPRQMPYRVFDILYNRQRKHFLATEEIGNEKLLIGYKALQNTSGETVAALAIPTFLNSPVYTEQILETTSYLLVLYFIIFGFFIAGSAIFSRQLTKPIEKIRAGLDKISRGNLDTKLPVTSRDEIGSLSEAYNTMAQRLKELQYELAKAEREAAWKEMAQQVAHEIKNPLTPMKLNLQHLQRRLQQNPGNSEELRPQVEKLTSNIIEQIDSLNKIASDFSKFAKPIREPFKIIELNELITSVADLYSNDEEIDLQVKIPEKPVCVVGVADELRRVFINLVKNGIEAMNNSGTLVLKMKRTGNKAIVTITDSGEGIRPENREKIFVPNFSTKSSGTGLGLAISKQIIEAHNGTIGYSSETGKGTSFTVTLPVSDSQIS